MDAVDREVLQTALLVWIASWSRGDPAAEDVDGQRFGQLALGLFAYQFEHIAPFQAFCRARGRTPATVRDWTEIPLVPASAWKTAELWADLRDAPAAVFETSGTSDGQPGRVALHDTACYDASLHATFAHFVVPDARPLQRYRCISLVPGRQVRRHSSLGYMVERLAARWDDGKGSQHLGTSVQPELDTQGCCQALERACAEGKPVLLFATSIALERWLAELPEAWRVRLPVGSRLMDTGGPKGRVVTLTRAEQHDKLCDILGLEADAVVGELGMTELCSQRYETNLRARISGDVVPLRAYLGPPWLRSRVLKPEDRSALPLGEQGMVAHVDLADLDTCAFVLTADLGRLVEVAGHAPALELAGRIPGSEWRGCGLDAEELLG
jgi:hypothetical protein